MKTYFIILLLLVINSVIFADSVNNDTHCLETIIVTASPLRDSIIGDISLTKNIITQEEIKKLPAFDVVDVIRQIPGVQIISEGVFGSRSVGQGRIKIRGGNVKVMIDGRPVNMELFNCIVSNVLTLNNIKQIEVIRGGESVLYGSDGLGGIIIIVTETPDKLKNIIKTEYGTDNTKYLFLNTQNKINKFYYSIGYELKSTDGHTDTTALDSNDYYVKIGYRINKHLDLSVSGKIYLGKFEDPIDDVLWDKQDRRYLNISLTGDYDKNKYYVQYHLTRGEHKNYTLATGVLDFHSKDFMNGIRTYHKITLGHGHFLYGFDYKKYGGEALHYTPPPPWLKTGIKADKYEWAPYFIFKQLFSNNIDITAGLRYNKNSEYGGVWLPKIGIGKYLGNDFKISFAANKSYRSPTILQTHLHNTKVESSVTLQPEEAWNYEIKTEYYNSSLFDVICTLYQVEGKNKIWAPSGIFPYLNIPFQNAIDYSFKGIELTISRQITSDLKINLGYDYIYTDYDMDYYNQLYPQVKDYNDNESLQYRNKFTGRADYTLNKWNFILSMMFINKLYSEPRHQKRLPDFTKVDLKTIYSYKNNIRLFLELHNILDEEYALQYKDDKTVMAPDFSVYGGIEAEF